MVSIELVRRVFEPRGDRVDHPLGAKGVRREQLQQAVAAGRRLLAEEAILLRRRGYLDAGLEGVALVVQPPTQTERRNARQRLIDGAQLPSYVVEADLQPETGGDLEIGVRFDALQQAVGGDEFDERELAVPILFFFFAGVGLVTEPRIEL